MRENELWESENILEMPPEYYDSYIHPKTETREIEIVKLYVVVFRFSCIRSRIANEFKVQIDEIILLRLQMLFKLEENNYIIICKNTLWL